MKTTATKALKLANRIAVIRKEVAQLKLERYDSIWFGACYKDEVLAVLSYAEKTLATFGRAYRDKK